MRLLLIGALLLSGASLLPSVGRPPPALAPAAMSPPDGWNTIAVDGRGGRYVVAAMVNGTPVNFLIDTGASHVVLAPADAARLGFRPEQLRFTGQAETANGSVGLAPVTLRELRIGQLSRQGVAAVVNRAPMSVSLLGMSFLDGLEAWEAKENRLLLYW